jgi:hypothetical protein
MKTRMVALLVVAAATVAGYGQGTIFIDNLDNDGVYNGYGGSVTDPVYSEYVTENGLIFTMDPTEQAGNLGGPAGSQLIGDDFSWALYGGSSPYSVDTLVASETGSQITGDNETVWWGGLYGGNSSVNVPGTIAGSIVYLDLYVWEGDAYSTEPEAFAAGDYAGVSGVFANPSGGFLFPLPSSLTGMPDIMMYQIPEPGTMALLAAGGALVLWRQRNRG